MTVTCGVRSERHAENVYQSMESFVKNYAGVSHNTFCASIQYFCRNSSGF